MLHNQSRRVNAALPDSHIIVAGVGVEQVPHGIPIDDDEPQDREGERSLQQHSSQSLDKTNTTATTSAISRQRHHPSSSHNENDGSSLALFSDALEAVQEIRELTSKVGRSVVLQQAKAVNKRVMSFDERQKSLLNNKRRKLNPEVPDKAPSSTAAVGSDHADDGFAIDTSDIENDSNSDDDDKENAVVDVVAEKAAADKAAVESDEEQRSIMSQATRMKRMSAILRHLEGLQSMFFRELLCCTVEQQERLTAKDSTKIE
jgi:hypothetical protein